MPPNQSKPTELAITLAALPGRYHSNEGWISSDAVRTRLKLLGFDCSSQQVAAWLKRMSEIDAPWIERRRLCWDERQWEYRVTRFGRTDIDNKLGSLRPHMPWLSTYGGAAA